MAVEFTIKSDDTLPPLLAVLKDDSDAVVDLTGVTGVRFIMTNKATNEVKVDAPANVVNAVAGLVEYSWVAEDTDVAATYNGEFEVEFITGDLETFPNSRNLQIKVFQDLGGIR